MLANYLGFEQEREAVYVYLEIEKAPALIEKVTVETSLLYDLYDDQVNLIHFSTQNKRKSAKLDYPAKAAQLEFWGLLHILSDGGTDFHKYFINPMAIHVYDFNRESFPLKFFTGFRNSF